MENLRHEFKPKIHHLIDQAAPLAQYAHPLLCLGLCLCLFTEAI